MIRVESVASTARKKIDASTTMTKTMTVVSVVSLRVGQVTFATSVRTCRKNSSGFLLAICAI